MKIDLSGKTALVTGSTAGIGFAIAKGLAVAGAEVSINGRSQARVDEAVSKLAGAVSASGRKVRGVAADVATAAGCDALIKAQPDFDILINNAVIFEARDFFAIPDQDWMHFFEANVMPGR
jgi:NAD(P)-dependent dehydrogenase (short-subunit alcohol dehydrogenase family)